MTLVREFDLFLTAGRGLPLLINVNQFDSGEEWHFTLYKGDGTQYIPSTGAIVGIKSDGLGIINSGTVVDGKVVIVETQQMTAAVGKATFELTIDSGTHGTANFNVLVEPKPGNNADLSDSDLSLIQEALNAVSPLPTGGTVGQVLTKTAQGSTWSDAGTPTQAQVAEAVSDWADENITVTTGVVIDQSLSVQGAAADAKKTGDEISDLKSAIALTDSNVIDGSITLKSNAFVNGTYNGSSFTTVNAKRIRTNAGIKVNKGSKITITPNTQSVEYDLFDRVAYTGDLNQDYTRTYSSSWVTTQQEIIVPNDKYVFFILKNSDDTALTPSDLTAVITVNNSYAYMLGERLKNYSEKAIFRAKPNWIDGFKIGSTGYRNASEGACVTSFYDVKQGDVIQYDLKFDNTTTWFIAFYTSTAYSASNFVAANSVNSINGAKKGTYIVPTDGYVVFTSKTSYPSRIMFADYIPDYVYDEKKAIPAYWSDTLDSVVSTARQNALTIGENVVDFFFITDAHWSYNAKHSPQIINKLSSMLKAHNVVFGGDIITGTQSTRELALNEVYGFYDLFENHIDLLSTIGNHDLNNNNGTTSAELTINEAYPLYIKSAERFAVTDKQVMGAVYDDESQKTRLIQFLHPTSSYSDSNVTSWLLAKIAEKTGWTVIVISHAYWNSMPAGTDLSANTASINLGKQIADTLAASDNNGFWLCGHTHRDFNSSVTSDTGHTLTIICSTTDAYMYGGSDGGPQMTLGTTTEQAFDFVQIDTKNRKVYTTRIGAGSNRVVEY